MTLKQHIAFVFDPEIVTVDKNTVSHPILVKETKTIESENVEGEPAEVETPKVEQESAKEKEEVTFEQISIFDDLD